MKRILNNILGIGAGAILVYGCTTAASDIKQPESAPIALHVNYAEPIAPIQPTMYGIFFEDINFAADGGIYAEMVKNRSFEFDLPMIGWHQPNSDRFSMNENSGFAAVVQTATEEANANFLRVEVKSDNGYTLNNYGFKGMGVKKDLRYDFSMQARPISGITVLNIQLVDSSGQVLGKTTIAPTGTEWKEYTASFTAEKEEMKAYLKIDFEGVGVIDLDMISLFPSDTWKNRPKGMRADLIQLLDDMDPGFLRFPGGCIVEGRTLEQRYQWKKTVGPIEERTTLINRWNTEFDHRPAPDYYQSFGLGYFEYFQLAEDMGAEALPILSCGIACQFNTGELVPMEDLVPYVQDALDLIEFANGGANSKWGKVRADMGHPEPFNMKFIGVGNEQWGPEYIKRYKEFETAIKAKYPEMIIVSGSGPYPDGEMFDYGMAELKKLDAEIIDEHYYRSPEWFLENADRYDSYDRNGPKVFAGEYAAQTVAIASPDNKNSWMTALSEAAFMTGLERNAEVVHLTSYAPLMAHSEGWQWTPDLIWFNNLESYGTPNYYVQKLFSTNKGTHVLEILEDGEPVIGEKKMYATAAKDVETNEIIIKIVNASSNAQETNIQLDGLTDFPSEGTLTVLKSQDVDAVNSFDSPAQITPQEEKISVVGSKLNLTVAPHSVSVIRVKANAGV